MRFQLNESQWDKLGVAEGKRFHLLYTRNPAAAAELKMLSYARAFYRALLAHNLQF